MTKEEMNAIVRRHTDFATLEMKHSDSLDICEVSKENLQIMLEKAYALGKRDAQS